MIRSGTPLHPIGRGERGEGVVSLLGFLLRLPFWIRLGLFIAKKCVKSQNQLTFYTMKYAQGI